jgi:hypothetical protein
VTPLPAVTSSRSPAAVRSIRRQNWIAITVATVVMMVSYFSYAAAFVDDDGRDEAFDVAPAAIGLALAPFVFVALAFLSKNPKAPGQVLRAMALLLVIALPVGLIDPLVGAAAGFGAGGAICLQRPPVDRVMRWRAGAVVFTAAYCLVLLLVAGPAGVMSGGVLPLVMLGFADEYATWSAGTAPS